jgi:hypothetical protein
MNLEQFAKSCGVVVSAYEDGYGGKYQYHCTDSPNVHYTGYKSIDSAYRGWLCGTFGEDTHKGILKLIDKKKPKLPYLGQKDLNYKEFLKILKLKNKENQFTFNSILLDYLAKGKNKLVVTNAKAHRDFACLLEIRHGLIHSRTYKAFGYSNDFIRKRECAQALINRLTIAFGVLSYFKDDEKLLNLHKEYLRLVDIDKELFKNDIVEWIDKYTKNTIKDTLYGVFFDHYESEYIKLLNQD